MVQRGGVTRFPEQLRARCLAPGGPAHDFNCRLPVESRVVREVDLPHAAFAEQGDDFVCAETGARNESHWEWLDYSGWLLQQRLQRYYSKTP
jgi:hypothetical protein